MLESFTQLWSSVLHFLITEGKREGGEGDASLYLSKSKKWEIKYTEVSRSWQQSPVYRHRSSNGLRAGISEFTNRINWHCWKWHQLCLGWSKGFTEKNWIFTLIFLETYPRKVLDSYWESFQARGLWGIEQEGHPGWKSETWGWKISLGWSWHDFTCYSQRATYCY